MSCRALLVPAAAVLAAVAVGCGGTTATVTPDSAGTGATAMPSGSGIEPSTHGTWRLDFDGRDPLALAEGSGTVTAALIGGGEMQVDTGPDGSAALRFPAFGSPHGLALIAMDAAGGLPNPGMADFSFGADVKSDGYKASDEDDGDNILQRGLAEDPRQYKLQVDDGRPSCVVKGSAGQLVAKLRAVLGDGWYRLRCDRKADSLTLTVTVLSDPDDALTAKRAGPLGSVEFEAGTPIAIGRKITASGAPVESRPDQFNGVLDNVWVKVS